MHFIKSMLLVGVILSLLFVTACAQNNVVCPDGTIVKDATACPVTQDVSNSTEHEKKLHENLSENGGESSKPASTSEPETSPTERLDPDVEKLLAQRSKVKSMSFHYVKKSVKDGKLVTLAERGYRVKGDLVRVDNPLPPRYTKESLIDTVFLNRATKIATGYCMNREGPCKFPEKREGVHYEEYDIVMPWEWNVTANAHIWGSAQFEKSEMPIIRFEKDGKYWELHVQSFYGVPLRIAVYDDPDYGRLDWEIEYQDAAFNRVQDADITPPEIMLS